MISCFLWIGGHSRAGRIFGGPARAVRENGVAQNCQMEVRSRENMVSNNTRAGKERSSSIRELGGVPGTSGHSMGEMAATESPEMHAWSQVACRTIYH